MKKYITLLVVIVLSLSSCSNQISLQKYFVTKANDDSFMSITLPSSLLQLKDGENNEDNKEILESFKRLNVLVFKNENSSNEIQSKEIETIKGILNKDKFKELIAINTSKGTGKVVFTGNDEDIDQVVGFGYNNEGFILARVTGKNMKVKDLTKLISAIDFEKSNIDDIMKNVKGN